MLFRVLTLYFGLIFVVFAAGEKPITPPENEALAYLNEHPKIRILVGDGAGAGNQSVSIAFVKRIRAMGYQGQIQMLASGNSLKALDQVLPDLKNADRMTVHTQYIESLRAELVSTPGYVFNPRLYPLEPLPLAFMGSNEATKPPLAKTYNVTALGIIQAPETGAPSISYDGLDNYALFNLHHTPVFDRIADPKNPGEYVHDQLVGTKYADKAAGLSALATYDQSHHVLAVYENIIKDRGFEPVVEALLEAQKVKPESFRGPIIIPVLSETRAGTSLEKGNETFGKLSPNVKVMDIGDKGISKTLAGLKPEDVLVLRVGSLPQDLFNYMLSRTTLPAFVTGTNSSNLLRSLGRPFITTSYFAEHGPRNASRETQSFLSKIGKWSHDSVPVSSLKAFFLESSNPDSSLVRDYQRDADEYGPANDRFVGIVLEVKKFCKAALGRRR